MKDTNDKQEHKNINFQTLGNVCLLIIAVLIIGNAILIYFMINSKEYENKINNIIEQNTVNETLNTQNTEKSDTVANILNTVISNNTDSVTISSTDANNRKIMNENLIVLYDGLILDINKMDKIELKYIDNNSQDKDKYVITYYNYENFAFKNSSLGSLSDQIYENLVAIENVGKIAISENYNALPREVKVINTLPTSVLDNNSKLAEFDSIKTIISDLDGNGIEEYIIILANKKTGYSKISLFDSNGKFIDNLAYIQKNGWGSTVSEYYLSLENLNIIDVDNDGIMEILVDIPKYEGESSVSILKYKNGVLEGKTNVEISLLP